MTRSIKTTNEMVYMWRDICYAERLQTRLKYSIIVEFFTKYGRSFQSLFSKYKKNIPKYLFVDSWKIYVHVA